MNPAPANPPSSVLTLHARAEADLRHLLPRVGPVLAAMLIVYTAWDFLLDPAHVLQSGMTRVAFAALAAIAFWPAVPNCSAHQRAAWAHWMLSSGVILASAQLDGGLVQGVGGIVIGLFLVPFIANGSAHFAKIVSPPALLFVACSALACTLPELLRGILLYASALAVAFVQMHIAAALRRHALAVESRLVQEASHDPLTGIHNRAWLSQAAALAFSSSRRYRTELAFAMLDIDHFKRVNDTYGHQTGDEVLKAVARTIQGALRETDHAGRFGGEEFFCIFPQTSDASARLCAERIRQAIAALEVPAQDGTVRVTISIGLARMQDAHATWEEVLKQADEALYAAKQSGRNCVRVAGDRDGTEPVAFREDSALV
ncbi:GGDEF domain-containing protein [Massilia sp. ST3]|uniref:GGDEF domain-containing protein n=1 Tax=Massilia sp. ST3 TaxID=2824903 RepID=UPI001B831BF3|nr:diguanylate cyclase [Massilia sp. ST3]MBQ5947421.1 diguanylate cyclase [Massilia sp. ST3]